VGNCATWMAKRPRCLARGALSWAWVSNGHFGFLCDINSEEPNAHLPLLISTGLGQKSPFLVADLEGHPAPLPTMASREDHDKRHCGESLRPGGQQLPSHRARRDASSS
jgi:hypothetical protein